MVLPCRSIKSASRYSPFLSLRRRYVAFARCGTYESPQARAATLLGFDCSSHSKFGWCDHSFPSRTLARCSSTRRTSQRPHGPCEWSSEPISSAYRTYTGDSPRWPTSHPPSSAYHREVHRLARVPGDIVRVHAQLHLSQDRRRADLHLSSRSNPNIVEQNAALAGRGCEQPRLGRIELGLQKILRLVRELVDGVLPLRAPKTEDCAARRKCVVLPAVID